MPTNEKSTKKTTLAARTALVLDHASERLLVLVDVRLLDGAKVLLRARDDDADLRMGSLPVSAAAGAFGCPDNKPDAASRRTSVLSSVPAPIMALWRRRAKSLTLSVADSSRQRNAVSRLPLISFSMTRWRSFNGAHTPNPMSPGGDGPTGKARQGKARQGTARQSKASQG